MDTFRNMAKSKIPDSLGGFTMSKSVADIQQQCTTYEDNVFFFNLYVSDKLLKDPRNKEALSEFVGWLAGYIFSISGHRRGVLIHMTHMEAMNPEQEEDLFVINVCNSSKHILCKH